MTTLGIVMSKHFLDVLAICSARVPIVKCKHKGTGFSVDINLSCPSSVDSTRLLLSSYYLIILAIFYLQQPLENYNNLPIVLPIKKLQANCNEHLVQCNDDNMVELYEKLIFDLHDPFEILPMKVNETKHVKPSINLNGRSEKPQHLDNEKQQHASFVFTPSRNDIKAIIAHKDYSQSLGDNLQVFKYWSKCYIKAVEIILSQLYRLELKENSTQQEENRSLSKNSSKREDIKSWFISGSTDLRTSCYHQKNTIEHSWNIIWIEPNVYTKPVLKIHYTLWISKLC
uniref:Uncharacterized protein n=1 Tax=Glossina palpalis gambiensis TaxID=67801 RepID=A0A1B0BXF6_9MUSC